MKRRGRQILLATGFLAPSVLGVSVFMVLPFADVVRRSFLDAMGNVFVGMDNYELVWENEAFRLAFRNTLRFVMTAIPLLFVFSLVLSLLVYRAGKGRRVFKTSLVLPMVIPASAVVLVWKIFLCGDGVVNQMLSWFSREARMVDWVHGETAFGVLVVTYLWKNIGYDMLLWLAGLSGISESIYDAARVDGAGRVAQVWYITLPCLSKTMGLVAILSVVNSFRVYRESYLLAGSYPEQTIYMVPHLFGHWFLTLDVQKMSTAAVILVLAALAVGGGARFLQGGFGVYRQRKAAQQKAAE